MKYKIYETAKGSNEFIKECAGGDFVNDNNTEWNVVNIVPEVEYQRIDGMGGAFTEAAAVTLHKLSPENQKKVLKTYFDPKEGIGYNYCRTHIHSCDFALGNYTYIEEGDKELKTFDISRDKKHLIPMIKEAKKYNDFKLFASPWSPPAFMKTNNEMNHGGKLMPEFFEAWSEYYIKYLKAYEDEGIDIFALTVQNEPKATQTWDSCVYTAEEERDFVKNYLGKKIKKAGKELYFWDHNRERIYDRAKVMLGDETAKNLVDGIAMHWYSGDHFDMLRIFHELYPDKKIIMSECCQEYSLGKIDTWYLGEKYAHDIIGCFNNYCNAYCDWNMLLNEVGGPNHVKNYCDAPIMADTQKDEIFFHSSYYYIGHFSKFIKAGAVRIATSKWRADIEVCAFKNADGNIVCVVMNTGDNQWEYNLRAGDCTAQRIKIRPHSIQTVICDT